MAGRGTELGLRFPPRVGVRKGDFRFRLGGEREEFLGEGELLLDFGGGDGVICEDEEAVCFGCFDELGGDLVDSRWEVVEGDFGDGSAGVFRFSHVGWWVVQVVGKCLEEM